MKRILTLSFAFLLLTAFECNKSTDNETSETKQAGTPKKALDEYIVIDKDKIDPADFTAWHAANSPYYSTTTLSSSICENAQKDNIIIIDLTKVGVTDTTVAKWLKANTDYICFDDSYPFIEKAHVITDADMQKRVNDAITNKQETHINFQTFVDDIKYYDGFNYEMYLNFTVDTSKKISFKPVNRYVKGMRSFSLPSIKSVVARYGIKAENFYLYTINFVEVKDTNGLDAIAFRLDKGATIVGFYDYSTNPGTGTGTGTGSGGRTVMYSNSIF